MATHLSDEHRNDLQALAAIIPTVAGSLGILRKKVGDTSDTGALEDLEDLAEALMEFREILMELDVPCDGTPDIDDACRHLTIRGQLIQARRRAYQRAGVPA